MFNQGISFVGSNTTRIPYTLVGKKEKMEKKKRKER